jgi:hypothetical protein
LGRQRRRQDVILLAKDELREKASDSGRESSILHNGTLLKYKSRVSLLPLSENMTFLPNQTHPIDFFEASQVYFFTCLKALIGSLSGRTFNDTESHM